MDGAGDWNSLSMSVAKLCARELIADLTRYEGRLSALHEVLVSSGQCLVQSGRFHEVIAGKGGLRLDVAEIDHLKRSIAQAGLEIARTECL